ncbi:MAG: hypothetical protein AB1480_17765 [Nitrospirota bacterium]
MAAFRETLTIDSFIMFGLEKEHINISFATYWFGSTWICSASLITH